MPNYKFDHQLCREKVCLLCLKKAKNNQALTERVKDMIEEVALPFYKHYCDLVSLPKVICETCRTKIRDKKKGKKVTMTVPVLSKFLESEMLLTGHVGVSQ